MQRCRGGFLAMVVAAVVAFVVGMVATTVIGLIRSVPAAAQEKTEVVVWLWGAHSTEGYQAFQRRVTALFEEEHPGATLRFEYGPNSPDRLVTAAAGGAVPDVSLASISYARYLYDAGVIAPLNNYMERTPHTAPDQFLPVAMIYNQKNGVYYGIPWSLEAAAILYNRNHLRAAGLDERPEAIRTWDDLVTYAQALTRRDASGNIIRNGYFPGRGVAAFASYVYANGGDFYREDESAVAFNSPQGREALRFMIDLKDVYGVTTADTAQAQIANEGASMVYWETSAPGWGIEPSAPNYTEWLGMAPVAQGPQGQHPSGVAWSNMFTIPTGAKQPDLSWAFIELWLRPEMQVANFEHFGGTNPSSPRRDFFQSSALADALTRIPHMAAIPQIMTLARPWPFIAYQQFQAEMHNALNQAWSGEIPPEAALAQSEVVANAALRGQ